MPIITKEVVATGLEVPEGPVVLPDGRVAFVQQKLGRVSAYGDGKVETISESAGSPNAVTLGADGCLYAAQNGGVVGDWTSANPCAPAIERIHLDGRVETVATQVAGIDLKAPNDLVFGADGRLYFTDPSEGYNPELRSETNRLFALGVDGGEVMIELDPSYTNGLAFHLDGRLIWVESYWRTVCALQDGRREVLATLPEMHIPDGLDVAADGRMYITTVPSHGVTVVAPDGEYLEHLFLDDEAMPTNCCLDGNVLWITDFGAGYEDNPGRGRLWRVEVDATGRPQTPGRA
ncbi:MAG: gluconolactonase [Glaciecola sp.]|jgi:gluconolactonase